MHVFLTSATGDLGAQIAAALLRDGHSVAGLTRAPDKAEAIRARGIEPVIGALRDTAVLQEAAARAGAVIHSALYHGPDTPETIALDEAAIAALARGLSPSGRLVLCTTSRTFGTAAQPITERDSPPASARSDIERAWSGSGTAAPGGRLLAHRPRTTLARLPLIVASEATPGPVLRPLIDDALEAGAVPLIGPGRNRLSLEPLGDAAGKLARLIAAESGGGRPLGPLVHLAPPCALRQIDIAGAIAEALGLPLRRIAPAEAADRLGAFAVQCLTANNILAPGASLILRDLPPRREQELTALVAATARAHKDVQADRCTKRSDRPGTRSATARPI